MKKYDLEVNEENIKKTIEDDLLDRNKNLVMLGKMLLNQDKKSYNFIRW